MINQLVNQIIKNFSPEFKNFKRRYLRFIEDYPEMVYQDGERKFTFLEKRYIAIIEQQQKVDAKKQLQISFH